MIQISPLELAWVMAAVGATSAYVTAGPDDWKLPTAFGTLLGLACFAIYSPLRTALGS